jgi:hypothetical protein
MQEPANAGQLSNASPCDGRKPDHGREQQSENEQGDVWLRHVRVVLMMRAE